MKRLLRIMLIVLLLVIIGGAVAFWQIKGAGSSKLEQWIGSQIQLIADSYLNPKLSFTDLDYEYPGTVRLKALRLTAPDPANPGTTIDIIATDSATLLLAEIPKIGAPIKIERITLVKPLFAAIAPGPQSKQFVGFSNLLRSSPKKQENPTVEPHGPQQTPKLSEIFQIRFIELIDGKIVYDPRIPGTQAMELDQINTRLDISPTDAPWYHLNTVIKRQPVFALWVAGDLNLDDMNTRLIVVNLKANLSQEQHTYLPPRVQKIVKEHEIRGVLDVNITGSVPIKDYKKGDLQANLSLAQANFSAGEYRMPIQTLNINARLADGKLMLSELALTALKGELKLAGSVALNHPMDTDLQLNVTDMMLQELMRASSPSHPPTLAGRLNVDIQATVPLRAVIAQANPSTQPVTSDLAAVALPGKWGSGRIDLDQARLVNLPVFGHLNQALAKGESIISPAQEKFDEKANLLFDFSGNGARFSQINYVGPVLAVRGTGTITLDQKLDLTLNGGPVEKVQAILGKQIGPTIGKLTDQLVAYRVTGTLKEPKVSLEVAGGATELAGDAAKAVKQGAGEAAKTVEKAGEAIIGIFEKKK